MKSTVIHTDTANEQIRRIILYINESYGSEATLQKVDESGKVFCIWVIIRILKSSRDMES